MNIEKVKNYNQKMLAAFSTILVITAAIGLISLVVYLIAEIRPVRKPNTNTLLSDEKIEQLNQDSLRQQIISYDFPVLIDTINFIYLIPVTVNTLEKPESVMGILDVFPGRKSSSSEKYFEMFYYGSFNNLLIYDYKTNITFKLSDRRFIGANLSSKYFKDDILITFSGAESDTDKDGKVTLNDLKSLFVYSVKEKKLRHISYNNSTVLAFEQIRPYKDFLITFGFDRNKDNSFDEITEPRVIMKYNFLSDSLTPIVDNELETDLQMIIDKK
jgi:hypothetical protein